MSTEKSVIAEWDLPKAISKHYTAKSPRNRLTDLSALNVFIGPNNAGKSRLLRALFKAPDLTVSPVDGDHANLRIAVDSIREHADIPSLPTPERNSLITLADQLYAPFYRDGQSDPIDIAPLQEVIPRLEQSLEQMRYGTLRSVLTPHQHASLLQALSRANTSLRNACKAQWTPNVYRCYVPALRGLRPLHGADDVFATRTAADYAINLTGGNPVFTGLTLYQDIRAKLLGTLQDRKFVSQYESFLSRRFFENKPVALIPRDNSDVLYVKIGYEHERAIFELGDGLQQVIIQTFPLFLYRDKHLLLFIEEPELYLHPGFQRLLINAFLDRHDCIGRQVFVATHSHQFVDLTLDHRAIAVYRVTKTIEDTETDERDSRFRVERLSDSHSIILRELGIHNSSVLLANCTIWVEGITDRMYVRRMLQLLQEAHKSDGVFVEDVHFAFVEYSGNNIAHWNFLTDPPGGLRADRLCSELFLITDRDDNKAKRHEQLQQQLQERYYCLECIEIENMLAPHVIVHVIKEYEGSNVKLKSFVQDDYKDLRLGAFIEQAILDGPSKRKGSPPYADASGTVKAKVDFAEYAVQAMRSVDDLSPEAQELVRRLYEFIKKKNPQ